jgi:hypothetical protein
MLPYSGVHSVKDFVNGTNASNLGHDTLVTVKFHKRFGEFSVDT